MELTYNEPITAGVLVDTMNSFQENFYNNFDGHYGPILERVDTYLGDMGKLKKAKEGPESAFPYHKPFLSLSGDVNVYYDPRTGRPGKATIKSWRDNVDFLGEYDLFSVIGDIGVGAILGGYLAGSWDAELQYDGIYANKDLVGTLAGLKYDLDLSEDGTEATASLDELKESLGNYKARLNVIEKRQDEFIIPHIGYNRYIDYRKPVKSDKIKSDKLDDEPDDVWKAYT